MSETLKELSIALKESRDKIAALNALSKEEGKKKLDFEYRLIGAMEAAGTNTVKNEKGTFTLTKSIQPHVKDWEAVHDYIRENDAFYLLGKSVLGPAYRELLDAGVIIPGIDPFERVVISVRKAD